MFKKAILSFVLLAGTTLSANAADIQYEGKSDGVNFVHINGEIVRGDSDQFDRITASLSGSAVVVLQSPGGLVNEGLNIGIAIRRNDYRTAVAANDVCASVCGLIWLAGQPRFLAESSKIGFHAAFRADGQESGRANALVGAYLSRLGFSYRAIAYLTDAPPDEMHWLTPRDAADAGINYSLIRPPAPEPRPFIAKPAPQYHPPSDPIASTAEQQAARVVQAYYDYWSQGGANVEDLGRYYADSVSFYGAMVLRDKVMDEKRKFSVRWPIRHYTVNPGSLFVQCEGNACSVSGVVAWDCTSQERGAHSVGTANFALRIVNGVIVSENGSVLTSHGDTVEQQQAATTVAYTQGRQARIEYEQWYAGLPDGGYKDGATFWATHRSDKPASPNCVGMPDWTAGCVAARARLNPSDLRRTTDKNFWWGWNSL
jgi:hypothetical protein